MISLHYLLNEENLRVPGFSWRLRSSAENPVGRTLQCNLLRYTSMAENEQFYGAVVERPDTMSTGIKSSVVTPSQHLPRYGVNGYTVDVL